MDGVINYVGDEECTVISIAGIKVEDIMMIDCDCWGDMKQTELQLTPARLEWGFREDSTRAVQW
jgi:hypothetical protein